MSITCAHVGRTQHCPRRPNAMQVSGRKGEETVKTYWRQPRMRSSEQQCPIRVSLRRSFWMPSPPKHRYANRKRFPVQQLTLKCKLVVRREYVEHHGTFKTARWIKAPTDWVVTIPGERDVVSRVLPREQEDDDTRACHADQRAARAGTLEHAAVRVYSIFSALLNT